MNNTKATLTIAAVATAAVLALAIAPYTITSASAKITQETTPPTCSNHNGQTIGSSCPGSSSGPGQGHTFTPGSTTCRHNPSSPTSCPPGQNP